MTQIAAVETEGDEVVRLRLTGAQWTVAYLLGFQAGMMMGPEGLDATVFGANVKPIGAGPYKIKAYEFNIRTQMVRNNTFWERIEGRPVAFDHNYVPDLQGAAERRAIRTSQSRLSRHGRSMRQKLPDLRCRSMRKTRPGKSKLITLATRSVNSNCVRQ